MQRNASLKKESELLKPTVVKLHEKEKQYDCGICHETFDEVPLFKEHARSVHVGHKAPFYTISFKEKAKSLEAPTSSISVKGHLNSDGDFLVIAGSFFFWLRSLFVW